MIEIAAIKSRGLLDMVTDFVLAPFQRYKREDLRSAYSIISQGVITDYDRGSYDRSVLRALNTKYLEDYIQHQPPNSAQIKTYISKLKSCNEVPEDLKNLRIRNWAIARLKRWGKL